MLELFTKLLETLVSLLRGRSDLNRNDRILLLDRVLEAANAIQARFENDLSSYRKHMEDKSKPITRIKLLVDTLRADDLIHQPQLQAMWAIIKPLRERHRELADAVRQFLDLAGRDEPVIFRATTLSDIETILESEDDSEKKRQEVIELLDRVYGDLALRYAFIVRAYYLERYNL